MIQINNIPRSPDVSLNDQKTRNNTTACLSQTESAHGTFQTASETRRVPQRAVARRTERIATTHHRRIQHRVKKVRIKFGSYLEQPSPSVRR
jgi:hypothetical protein